MKTLKTALLASALALLAAAPAFADTATFSLNTANPTIPAGSTITFNGTISAPSSNTDVIYLLGDTFTLDGPLLLNDADFFLDTPVDLTPGQTYNGPLFTVTLPGSTVEGMYKGSFQIDLADASFNTFSDNASFQVTATPEPDTWLLLCTGLGAATVLRRRLQTAL